MTKVNRFIQFNDEMVDVNQMLLYERIGRALSDAPFLELTERKLMEIRPAEGGISMSVYWRHRPDHIMHGGRLSDIYLLTAGFWRHFSVPEWVSYRLSYRTHPLRKFAEELLLLIEEFRLIDATIKERAGTEEAFQIRKEVMLRFHKDHFTINYQKGFVADALLNMMYISLNEGMHTSIPKEWSYGPGTIPLPIDHIHTALSFAYDAKSTKDSRLVAERIIALLEEQLEEDLLHQYYAIGDALNEKIIPFHYHEGMKDAESGEGEVKETIEEVFRSFHRENKSESGVHLEFELEHGRSGKGDGSNAVEGHEDAQIEEMGKGSSKGDQSEKRSDEERDAKKGNNSQLHADQSFGPEHLNVVYEERAIQIKDEYENKKKIIAWRENQKPFVRSFVDEMKKRIEQKREEKREGLVKGRLSSKLTTMMIDERPRPFYRKNIPSTQLDAVFGLLVDGSASMADKLDETKQAVLLFHDVLRELQIQHEITSYYEDANYATKERQPNVFELMHTFADRNKDDSLSIMSFDANEDNRDGFAIRWMTKRLLTRQEQHKFLLVFSDGEPSAFGYAQNGVLDTREAVVEAEKLGVTVIHLFLSAEETTVEQRAVFTMMFGNKSAASDSVEQFTDQILRILRKTLSIVINQ